MRVIAGSARRIPLKTPEGLETRPTTDRIKETLFNMIQYDLADSSFLDLFSGSGSIGIEALSRGAENCVFVEQNPLAASVIRDNLAVTKLEDKAQVMECDVFAALRKLEEKGSYFDWIFLDPPYRKLLEQQVLTHLKESKLIDKQSTVIIEAALDTDFSYLDDLGFVIEKNKEYKTNRHVFVYRGE